MAQKDEYILNSQHTDINGKVYNAGDKISLTQAEANKPIFVNKLRTHGVVVQNDLAAQGQIDNLQTQLDQALAELEEARKQTAELEAGKADDTGGAGDDTGDGKTKQPKPPAV